MKLRMAKNSLFAILLRKPWWVSLAIAAALGLVAAALLPAAYKAVGVFSGLPFLVIAAVAAWRQARLPSAARVEATRTAVAGMAWPAFAALLERAFAREGWRVERAGAGSHDFVLEREGRRMLVGARRWKSAQTGLEALRALQAAREQSDASDALLIGLGALSDAARTFAAGHRIGIWQAPEIARALDGLLPAR